MTAASVATLSDLIREAVLESPGFGVSGSNLPAAQHYPDRQQYGGGGEPRQVDGITAA